MMNASYIIIALFFLFRWKGECYGNPSALYYLPHCVRASHSVEGLDEEGSLRQMEHGLVSDVSFVDVIMFSSKYMFVIKTICNSSIFTVTFDYN